MSLFEQVRETIETALRVPPGKITERTRAEDIAAWDSIGQVNLVMAIEQTFNIYLDVEDFPKMSSVPAILAYLKEQGLE